jgi:hypothetical protein
MIPTTNLPGHKELFNLESDSISKSSNKQISRNRDPMPATSMCTIGNDTDCSTPWLQKFILTLKGLREISQVCMRQNTEVPVPFCPRGGYSGYGNL